MVTHTCGKTCGKNSMGRVVKAHLLKRGVDADGLEGVDREAEA